MFSRFRALWLALLGVAIIAVACRDVVAPSTVRRIVPSQPARVTIPSDADLQAKESSATATAHESFYPSSNWVSWPVIGTYPTTTVVQGQISGTVSGSPWPQPWYFSEKGYLGLCTGWIPGINGGWNMCAGSSYMQITAGYAQLIGTITAPSGCNTGAQTPPPNWDCCESRTSKRALSRATVGQFSTATASASLALIRPRFEW